MKSFKKYIFEYREFDSVKHELEVLAKLGIADENIKGKVDAMSDEEYDDFEMDYEGASDIGSGHWGTAFLVNFGGKDYVVKLTSSDEEMYSAIKIRESRRKFANVANIFDVSEEHNAYVTELLDITEDICTIEQSLSEKSPDWRDNYYDQEEDGLDDEELKFADDISWGLSELGNIGVAHTDSHCENIGIRHNEDGSYDYVVFDVQ
jgi:hypothetical protein